jgi:rhodanese-related sulfurtransferase
MPHFFHPKRNKQSAPSFSTLWSPIEQIIPGTPILVSKGDRPLQMNFEDQLKSLVYFHLEEHRSAAHLLQVLEEDEFAREQIAPEAGIKKSSFSEVINTRGLEQLTYVFQELQKKATNILPKEYAHLGDLVAIDGSLIDAVLSMYWADYRKGSKKAKIHLGFDLNRSIPLKLYLTNGKQGERPFVSQILSTDQTGVLDRGYQCHELFDAWQEENKHFVCRIRANTKKTVIRSNELNPGSLVFYDAIVLLGTPGINQTQKSIRLVGYRVGNKDYWVATNRYDLFADDIALIFKLRWEIEKFFAWWKKHLKVYHVIARSEYGLMVQILSGLITYLLLAIYCYEQHHEKVSIKRVRELRNKIQNELRTFDENDGNHGYFKERKKVNHIYAKT